MVDHGYIMNVTYRAY